MADKCHLKIKFSVYVIRASYLALNFSFSCVIWCLTNRNLVRDIPFQITTFIIIINNRFTKKLNCPTKASRKLHLTSLNRSKTS